jgi:hypothetical protein
LTSLSTLTSLYNFLSVGSFIFIWVPTAILLKTFSLRFGKIKYWLLVTIPVLYFLVPFFIDELGILDELRLEYGRHFSNLDQAAEAVIEASGKEWEALGATAQAKQELHNKLAAILTQKKK